MDFMDLIVDSADEYLTGYFYKKRPKSQEDGRIKFNYRQLDPNSRVFGKLLGEVRADRASYAIKTNDMCGFNIGGYIVTQNGLIWQITEVITNEESKGSNDALRWFKKAVNAECSVRMVQIDNLYDIDEAYQDICEITITLDTSLQIDEFVAYVMPNYSDEALPYQKDGNKYIIEVPKNTGAEIEITANTMLGTRQHYYKISARHTLNNTYNVIYKLE